MLRPWASRVLRDLRTAWRGDERTDECPKGDVTKERFDRGHGACKPEGTEITEIHCSHGYETEVKAVAFHAHCGWVSHRDC